MLTSTNNMLMSELSNSTSRVMELEASLEEYRRTLQASNCRLDEVAKELTKSRTNDQLERARIALEQSRERSLNSTLADNRRALEQVPRAETTNLSTNTAASDRGAFARPGLQETAVGTWPVPADLTPTPPALLRPP